MAVEVIIRGKDQSADALHGATQNVRKLGDEAESSGGRLKGFFSFLGGAAMAGGLAAAAGIGAIGAAGLTMNNQMEQSSARIQAFTKDSEKTAEVLEMVRDRAAKTPFAFNEMSSAAAALLPTSKMAGEGLEDLLGIAEVLAASNPAEGLEGAAFALKEAVSGDFTSIIERFNLPRSRLKELREQGVPDLEAVQIAMQELGLDADLVAGLAGTADGRWSTFMDTLQGLASTLTQPIFTAFSEGLGQVQGQLDANMPAIQAFAEGLAGQIGGAISWLISDGVPALVAGWQSVQPALAAAGAAFVALVGFIAPIVAVLMAELPGALAQGQAAFQTAQAVITPLMQAIGAIVGAMLTQIAAFWQANGASIMATAQTMFRTLSTIFTNLAAILTTIFTAIAGFINRHGSEIQAYLTAAWNLISSIITTALNLISGVVKTVLQLVQGDFRGAWDTITSTAASFVTGLVGVIENGAKLLGAAVDLGIAAVTSAWEALTRAAPEIGSGIIGGIVSGISNGVGALKDAVQDAAQRALDAAKDFLGIQSPSRLFAAAVGLPIAQGMAAGIVQGAPLVRDAGLSLSGAAYAGGSSYSPTYQVDARGAGMSRAQLEAVIRDVQDRAALDAEARRRMR